MPGQASKRPWLSLELVRSTQALPHHRRPSRHGDHQPSSPRATDGADIKADTIDRTFRRAKNDLKKAGIVGFYDNLAWIIWEASDKPGMAPDK